MGELRTSLRVRGEGAGIVMKTAVTFFVIFLGQRGSVKDEYALVAFALGQFAYALTLFLTYTRYYGFNALRFIRQQGPMCVCLCTIFRCFPLMSACISKDSFNSRYLKLSMSMTTQSIFKHLLTEGDKFLVSQISALEDQGGYALASNYGEALWV
jgi:oligosaccharide translocation protein RFT1